MSGSFTPSPQVGGESRPATAARRSADIVASHCVVGSVIQTAKLNGIDPMVWLTDVLERVVSGRTKANELNTLMPWNWTASRKSVVAQLAA